MKTVCGAIVYIENSAEKRRRLNLPMQKLALRCIQPE
jgi:hypothetical protein